jgi:hypothetical protein
MMGWSIGYDENWKRDIGYGVPATCDQPKCDVEIDRGLSYVCGGEPFGGEHGCGLYFCSKHLWYHQFKDDCLRQVCVRCNRYRLPFKPKPDVKEWIDFKMTDSSWAEWREQNKVPPSPRGR